MPRPQPLGKRQSATPIRPKTAAHPPGNIAVCLWLAGPRAPKDLIQSSKRGLTIGWLPNKHPPNLEKVPEKRKASPVIAFPALTHLPSVQCLACIWVWFFDPLLHRFWQQNYSLNPLLVQHFQKSPVHSLVPARIPPPSQSITLSWRSTTPIADAFRFAVLADSLVVTLSQKYGYRPSGYSRSIVSQPLEVVSRSLISLQLLSTRLSTRSSATLDPHRLASATGV